MAGKLTARADKFARKMVGEKPEPDLRSTDEKLADFHREYGDDRLKRARQAVKEQTKYA